MFNFSNDQIIRDGLRISLLILIPTEFKGNDLFQICLTLDVRFTESSLFKFRGFKEKHQKFLKA